MASRALGQDLRVGLELGHYRIVEKIGAGGMGEVYRASDEHLARDVAIKVLPPGTLTDESARKHFHKEALILSQLNHPNVATIHDFDTQQGVDFLVMEYIPGITLSEKVAGRPLPEKEVLRLGVQLAEGLAAAHDHGVVHRDLKPGNLRVTSDGRLKILDFGLAKLWRPVTASAATESLSETQAMAGTVPYMAPEQLLGGAIDARTDLHAAGSVLYEMATGQRPFAEVEHAQLIAAILHRPPRPPTALNPHVSPELERIIGKCLEKEPGNRYQSAKELAVDMRRLGTPSIATQASAQRQARKYPSWKIILVLGMTVAVLLGAGVQLLRSRRAHALTERDTIVLGDFDNKTGDPVFDDTLKQALAVHLEQSPFLNVLSDEKVNATLRLMGREPGEHLTAPVARDLCQRAGSKAMLAGSIANLGTEYIVGLQAIQCNTGDSLAKEQTEAAGKEQVLKALGNAATALRRKFGESLASVQKYDTPLEQATTSSLEALKAYSAGWRTFQQHGDLAAIPFYKRAIELDPNFALAYSQLAIPYSNTGQATRASEAAKRAFELRDRVSEHEKYRISAYYYLMVTGELQKSQEAYELWRQTYPRDLIPYIDLAGNYMIVGQWERALPEAQQALQLDPQNVFTWVNLVFIYFALNRPEEAKVTLDQAQARNLDVYFFHLGRYYAAFLSNDSQGMKQQLSWGAGRAEEHWVLAAQSDTETYFGRLVKAREFSQGAIDSARAEDAKETAAFYQANAALHEAEFRKASSARQQARAALSLTPGQDARAVAALALARAGDIVEARRLAEALGRDFPLNTVVQAYWLPTIRAAIELNGNNSEKAVELLRPATAYELGQPPGSWVGMMYPLYLRGQAYLRMGKGTEAAAEFQKIVDHRGIVLNFPTGALARLGLARAYAMQGDSTKAKMAYQDFLALWKDADPDIPILKEAKAEYAKLQ
jgi:eukaryotic-like serine/threonine-protein kinase